VDSREALVEENGGRRSISPWQVFASELVGTALLVMVGLSVVILIFGEGSPVKRVIPSEGWRRLITGFLFGTTGALIALSPVGVRSGAHINPVVTVAFWLMGKLDLKTTFVYVTAQLSGAVLGALPLRSWGGMGRSVVFGATLPGEGYAIETVLLGEVITTFTMVALLCMFLAFRRIRPFTPGMFPLLYAVMVYVESPISGTSTNPARSLGPGLVSGRWEGWWIYWVGPLIGSIAACLACSALAKRITIAKLYYFETDHDRLFRKTSRSKATSK
jgi:aquaporin Z